MGYYVYANRNELLFDFAVEADELIVREAAIFVDVELVDKCGRAVDREAQFLGQNHARFLETDEAVSVCVELLELAPELFFPAPTK